MSYVHWRVMVVGCYEFDEREDGLLSQRGGLQVGGDQVKCYFVHLC